MLKEEHFSNKSKGKQGLEVAESAIWSTNTDCSLLLVNCVRSVTSERHTLQPCSVQCHRNLSTDPGSPQKGLPGETTVCADLHYSHFLRLQPPAALQLSRGGALSVAEGTFGAWAIGKHASLQPQQDKQTAIQCQGKGRNSISCFALCTVTKNAAGFPPRSSHESRHGGVRTTGWL